MQRPGQNALNHDQPCFTLTKRRRRPPHSTASSVCNVHPDTNKTMLKSLFAQAFQDQDQDGTGQGPTGLDLSTLTGAWARATTISRPQTTRRRMDWTRRGEPFLQMTNRSR
ncbi:hypothetical protein OG21DRAFT_1492115 [Imleria badia]|nr:hypothetical protein OG21DRAFT_1492115 [Imleria badia]